jgi:hypothetical protein
MLNKVEVLIIAGLAVGIAKVLRTWQFIPFLYSFPFNLKNAN